MTYTETHTAETGSTTKKVPIAVIILNWNGEALLREYLPQVIETTDSSISRLIVADNGSTDASVDYLRSSYTDEQLEILELPENYGFAEGYNRAIEAVGDDYQYVVLLNSDVATNPGWDRILLDYMEKNPTVGAVQPKLLSYAHPELFEYAGAAGGFLDKYGYPYCRGRIFATCEEDHNQYDTPLTCHWASGACLMVRRELYINAGGLDPKFFAHMEEIDLCWRIRLLGYEIACQPVASIRHLGGGSLPAENPKKTYLNFRNNLLMLHKNLPDSSRTKLLFIRRLLDTIALVKYMLTFDFANAKAIFKAHRAFSKMRREYTNHPDKDLLNPPSQSKKTPNILIEYYLKRHKKFSEVR